MKKILFLIIVLLIPFGVSCVKTESTSKKTVETSAVKSKQKEKTFKTLEEKLEVLAKNGLKLSKPFTIEDLLKSSARKDYEKDGYDLVISGLAMTEEEEPWRPHCEKLADFDMETIEGTGSYVEIAERLLSMSGGSLEIKNIQDHVDIEKGEAWITFTYKGNNRKIDFEIDNDWADPNIFYVFAKLLNESDPDKVYVMYNTGGQDVIIGCVTRNELKVFQEHGVKFQDILQ